MATSETAKNRAKLTNSGVIDARTLETSHKRLAEIVKPGMTVLDVGCGTGAITSGIAKIVGNSGEVIGIDNNPELIERAHQKYKDIPQLAFQVGDIYNLLFDNTFDIVTSARVLQWLADPQAALNNMVKAVKVNGKVVVLDYNHEKISWEPEVPASMNDFYAAFLRWRSDSGMDNAMADKLSQLFKNTGLEDVKVTAQHEETKRESADFHTQISIWAGVAAFKGAQMVNDGFIEEAQREKAESDFRKWIEEKASKQKMYLLAVEGSKVSK